MRNVLRFTALLILGVFPASAQQDGARIRTLIVIFDGLRPDYITAEDMPHLFALKESGSYVADHHSVFPTVTRVNASSYVTGSYPARHGILGNAVFFPRLDKAKALNTGDFKDLLRIKELTGDKLLTVPSIGELLWQSGEKMMVFSSGSSGQAYLQNHTVNGGIVNPELILPSSLREDIMQTIGPPPQAAKPNTAQHDWVSRAWMQYALADDGPLVSAIWFSDPDGTAHTYGIGSPLAVKSLKIVDQEFGEILHAIEKSALNSSFNVIVTADHGFVTETGKEGLGSFLIKQGLKKDNESDDVVLAGNAVYVKDQHPDVIKKIVAILQRERWVGAIFTRSKEPRSTVGWVDGTLSFETIHWNHATRSADILVDYNWSDGKNSFGFPGTSDSPGVAGHGGSSRYEINIPLVASGPSFKRNFKSELPSSNTDIAPTILHICGLTIPSSLDGRVLTELLQDRSTRKDETLRKEMIETMVDHPWGRYHLVMERSLVGKQQYVNFTRVKRPASVKKDE